jgi:23S rRNA (guanosine2251-2'-O)-methyltransferase
MAGGVSSLNVSAAGAVVLYEAARQRRAAANSLVALAQKAAPRSGAPSGAAKTTTQKGLGS